MSGLGKESLIVRPLKNFQLPANSCVLHDTAVCFEDLSGFAIGNFHSPDHRVVPAVTLAEVVGMKMIGVDRKRTRLNSSHYSAARMPSSACKKKQSRKSEARR